MKNKFLFTILSLSFVAFSCGSFETNIVKDNLTEETNDYEININESFINSDNEDVFNTIDPVNIKMAFVIDSLINATKDKAVELFTTLEKSKRPAFKFGLNTADSVFIVSKQIVSTKITAYIYDGGAHGITKLYFFNYSPKTMKFLTISDILDLNKKDEINDLIDKYFENPEDCFRTVPTIDNVTGVNVTEKSIIFSYEQYVLGAYSCGMCDVEVPLKELKEIYKL